MDFNYYRTISSGRGNKGLYLEDMQSRFDDLYENHHITFYDALIGTKKAKNALINFETEIRCLIYDEKLKEMILNANNRKLLTAPNTVKTGDYVSVKLRDTDEIERTYIVRNLEDKLKTHDKSNILFCQQELKFINAKNEIVKYPVHMLETKSLLKDDGQLYMTTPYSFYSFIIQDNKDTQSLKDGMRFMLKGRAYRISGHDDLSMNGLITVRFETDEKTINDNAELGVADYYSNNVTDKTETQYVGDKSIIIGGEDVLIINQEQTYSIITNAPSTVMEWSVESKKGEPITHVKIVDVCEDKVVIKCSDKRRSGGSFVLVAKTEGEPITKTINITREY